MKIINIASSDNFEDILDAVNDSDSNSVILIVPKSNRAFKSKSRVEKLKKEFDGFKKSVSIISSSSEIVKNAAGAGFVILSKTDAKPASKKEKENDIVSFYSESSGRDFRKIAAPKDSKKNIFGFLAGAIAFFVFIVFASLGEAEIEIIPDKKDFSVSIPVTVSDKIIKNDDVYGLMPGKWIEMEKLFSRTFVSSSEKDVFQKAVGRISVYNNFSSLPQILVATTRFQTAEGLVFRIRKTITVPGVVKIGNESKPGEIEAEVLADRAGAEYNIEPSDFRIPGFMGIPKYQGFYAKSFENFKGGFTGKSNFVSKEDFQKAEEETIKESLNEIKNELVSLDGFKILDEAMKTEIENQPDSNKIGDLAKEFKISVKIKAKLMAFKEENASDFIGKYIKNSQDFLTLENGFRLDYAEPKLNEEKRELFFKLNSSGQAIKNIDKNAVISESAGKKRGEAEAVINNLEGVESARISLPFWLRTVPKNAKKIKIRITTE